ncbi:very-long-chain (3R)-3-hydroxyacyl-CoA dehydratase 4 isoform X3 [Eretmochelys imbricata]
MRPLKTHSAARGFAAELRAGAARALAPHTRARRSPCPRTPQAGRSLVSGCDLRLYKEIGVFTSWEITFLLPAVDHQRHISPLPSKALHGRNLPWVKRAGCTMYTYLFIYYLIQFCGHSWIFTNMTIRFLSFGKDSLADTFYSIGFVMCLCQSLSILELLHILAGIEKNCFLPRFLQITERIIILFVITSQEEVQGKYIVCVLFFLWNLLDVVRYTYCMLSVTGTYYEALTWLNYTLWIPVYPLSILAKGMYFITRYLCSERKAHLGASYMKEKRS